MDFSNERKQEQLHQDSGLIDAALLQRLQDQFCRANNLYLVCLDRNRKAITKPYGSDAVVEFLKQEIGAELYGPLIDRLMDQSVEKAAEQQTGRDCLRLCGVSVSLENTTRVIWMVSAILEENVTEEEQLPEGICRTTEDRLNKSLEFLEALSKQLFATKLDELIAQEAMLKSMQSEKKTKEQLKRSETMGAVVKKLESENGFAKIIDDMLAEVCMYLDISEGALIRENTDRRTLDMICEYSARESLQMIQDYQGVEKAGIPFFNGKPYIISTDSILPEQFEQHFLEKGIRAGVFLPLDVDSQLLMYVCFCERERERSWSNDDIEFLNDVKRVIQSILTKRIAQNSLASSYASLEAILENVGCGVYVLDLASHKVLYTNQMHADLFRKDMQDGTVAQIIYAPEEERTKTYNEVYAPEWNRWFIINKSKIEWVDGREVMLCTVYDITEKKEYEQKIELQANNDFLTGLYNRMRCEKDLERAIREAEQGNGHGALFYIDLDDFKHINDGLGHQYGDILLQTISKSLQRVNGIESSCYRMGGDEFIVILSMESYPQLEQICEEIRIMFSQPWYLKESDYYCTMSMGVVKFPDDGNTVEDVIRKADMALYEAKRSGKNRVEFYRRQEEMVAVRRLDMEKNMRNATVNSCDEFEVYYQPLVDIQKPGNPCCGAEALVRWNSGEMGFMSPVDFIPLAEYLGLINPIGDFVLRQAARRCKNWNDMGHPEFKINVNLSVVQLLQNDIVEKIRSVLEETRIAPYNLTLEVTESLAINDMERMRRVLNQIKELGCHVALDDFGTGYSSLNHIREIPLDMIKIDRCFVEKIAEDDFSGAFVKMVSELAATLGVTVCVEGVEERKQLDRLKRMKIGQVQGYYFGKPMRLDEFEKKFVY